MLSETLVEEFQRICREEFGVAMSNEDAARNATWLAEYFDALAAADGAVIDNESSHA